VASRSYGQYCGVTTAVELVAERWALLIIRDLLVGPRRYTDLKQGLPNSDEHPLGTPEGITGRWSDPPGPTGTLRTCL